MSSTNPEQFPEQAHSIHSIHGVVGRYHGATVGPAAHAGTFTRQRWTGSKRIPWTSTRGNTCIMATMRVEIRFDDVCRNGHNSFSITAEVRQDNAISPNVAGPCHDLIAEHFPELAHLTRWHLFDTRGPLHYLSNTLYLAGDRDHNGRRKGEPERFEDFVRFGTSPISHKLRPAFAKWLQDPDVRLDDVEAIRYDHEREPDTFGPKFTFGGYAQRWHECPFDDERTALEWAQAFKGPHEFGRTATSWSKGKPRELDAARAAACWPEATDEELSVEREELEQALRDRLPALLDEFRAAVESCGFAWEPKR